MHETIEISNPSWERQEGESSKAYSAFCAYRDYGVDRSIVKVVQKYSENVGSKAQLFRWSSKYDWVQRCNDFDIHTEKQRRKEIAAYLQLMSERHAQNARMLQDKALKALQGIDPSTLSNAELLKYLEAGMKMEKEAIGYVPVPEEPSVTVKDQENKMTDELLAMTENFLKQFKESEIPEETPDFFKQS
jgi:hypothetical protein